MERADGFERGRVEYIHNERVASNGSSTSRAEIEDVVANFDATRRRQGRIRRMEHLDCERSSYYQGVNNRADCNLNVDRPEYVNFHGEDTFINVRTPIEPLRSRPPMDQWDVIREGPGSYYPPARGASGQGRFNYFLHHDQGPQGYDRNSYYEQNERARYPNHGLDGSTRVENLENTRAELLRKLDELRDQLILSCDMTEQPEGRTGTDQRMISPTTADPYPRNHAAYIQEGSSSSHGVNKQPLAPDDMASPCLNQAPGFVPYIDRHSPILRDSYPQRGYPHELLSHPDTYQQETSRRPPPYHEHFHGYHGNVNHDLFVLHPYENLFDQPACSCVHCCNKNWYLPPKVDPSGLYQRSQDELPNPNYHHHLYPIRHEPRGYNSGGFNLPTLHSQQSLALNSTEVESENDGPDYDRPRKVEVAHTNGQVWHPVAGGAPFIACCNCFELLKLPRKRMSLMKNQQKLKCGACSSIILFEPGNKGSTVPLSGNVDHVSTEIDDGSIVAMDENVRYQHGGSNFADMNASSNSYTDSRHKVSPPDRNSDSGETEKQLDPVSSALSLSEYEQTTRETLASGKHGSPSAELHVTEVETLPHPRLSSEECPDYCSANIVVSQFDKGNERKRSESDPNTSWKNYVDDQAVSTEMDMSLDEFSNSGVSQDFEDKSKEHQPMVKEGAEFPLADLMKKSLGDLTKLTEIVEDGESQVFVNGHLIPNHLVKKAEKLAGSIQPGEYWYDVRAGFWGVMGHPCLGIIMPNIEEFNYPMPDNCAAGNSGVFVNGRELHQRDLELLVGRGLPDTRDGSYLVEISGKVFDEHTGEELHSLGKLAPTVGRAKHGFGMKVPRFLARLQS